MFNFSNSVQSLRFRYLLAISLIALLVTGSYISMQKVIEEQKNYSKVINLASHQSGLANRIAYFSSLMATTSDESEFATARFQVGFDIILMDKVHQQLLKGDAEESIPVLTSDNLQYIYFDKMVNLDRALKRFLKHARDVHQTPMNKLSIDSSAYIYLTTYGPHVLQPMFDSAVDEYEVISSEAINKISEKETFIWIMTLIVLILELILIFRPLELGIKSSIKKLQLTVEELEVAQSRLKLASSVFDFAHDAIMISDEKHNVIEINQAFTRVTGFTREEMLNKNVSILNHNRQQKIIYDDIYANVLKDDFWSGEIWSRRKNGEPYAELITVTAVFDEHKKLKNFITLIYDITEQKDYQKNLERNAHYDSLTGLPNRVLVSIKLNQAMLKCQHEKARIGVAYLDLDGFKAINDIHGHDVGDRLLVIVSKRMQTVLRETDTIGRIGGDEFVIVISSMNNHSNCEQSINRLLAAASKPIILGDSTLQVTASIGLTVYSHEEDVDADQLLRRADQAMYQAKLKGKNQFCFFDSELALNTIGQFEIQTEIAKAIIKHEFELFYQPKVNMLNGEINGVEALIRWRHPEQGLLSPDKFLPSIEQEDVSLDLGYWVITEAIRQMNEWSQNGLEIPVSINISAYQLAQEDFTSRLAILLQDKPAWSHNKIILEILETSALEDIDHVSQVMNECKQLGVIFSLDDFGTGYSSLTYLRRLPISQIKIDKAFVQHMLNNEEDKEILNTIVNLAKALKFDTIAEGVETFEHGELLMALGCNHAQGFYISKPIPSKKIEQWTKNWSQENPWQGLSNNTIIRFKGGSIET